MNPGLFSAVCNIAKLLIKDAGRIRIRNALRGRRVISEKDIQAGMGNDLHYYVRKIKAQFTGYLLFNANLATANSALPDLMSLSPMGDEQWGIVSDGDKFIRSINASAVAALSAELGPELGAVCDPYTGFKEVDHHPGSKDSPIDLSALDAAKRELLDALVLHPSIAFLKSVAGKVSLPPPALLGLVLFVKRILEEEPGRPTEDDIEALRGTSRKAREAQDVVGRFGTHLFAIRKALAITDGLLFDAFFLDRLTTIDSTNCFAASQGRDRLGQTIRVEFQPTGEDLERVPGDVLYLSLPANDYPGCSGPVIVENMQISMSSGTGMTVSLDLRLLDDWLNPYPALLAT
jgi:hypothetical protein